MNEVKNQCPKCKDPLVFDGRYTHPNLWFCNTCVEYLRCVNIKIWQEAYDNYLKQGV